MVICMPLQNLGLGVEINWDKMKTKIIHSFYCDKNKKVGLVHA